MKVVIINHLHPTVRHVSGMRAWFFAMELAKRGHQVVLLCGPTPDGDGVVAGGGPLNRLLAGQDWTAPLVLPVLPRGDLLLASARARSTPALVRKSLLGASYYFRSGVFTDFLKGVRELVPDLAMAFRPDVIWGIFGNTDCWQAARELSLSANAPWVGDVKDNWEIFVPPSLRTILAGRFRNMASATANADFHGESFERWSGRQPTTVYSGVADCFLGSRPPRRRPGPFRITVTGSIRSTDALREFARGVSAWAGRWYAESSGSVELTYAGADVERARDALDGQPQSVNVIIHPYRSLEQLAELCRQADVNAYVRNEGTFHHKVLELLACGRPVLPYPPEGEEAKSLSKSVGGLLLEARNPSDVSLVLACIAREEWVRPCTAPRMEFFRWASQVRILESVLMKAAAGKGQT